MEPPHGAPELASRICVMVARAWIEQAQAFGLDRFR